MSTRILVIDNYDSFVYTIVGYLEKLGAKATVIRNDQPLPEFGDFNGVLVSPGPGNPKTAGTSMEAIKKCAQEGLPMLGVCLGHQALAEVFGATVTHCPELIHGKTSLITHDSKGVFAGLQSPLRVTRYHSLAVKSQNMPAQLEISAHTENGIIMGIRHRELPLEGVQFHPESVLTQHGHSMIANWLRKTGQHIEATTVANLAPIAESDIRRFSGALVTK